MMMMMFETRNMFRISVREFFCQGRGGGGGGGGEAVNHLPKKFFQVAQIFTKQSKGIQGPTYEVKMFLHVNLSYELKKHFKT